MTADPDTTSPCIGWHADGTPCGFYGGDMHGCWLPDGHHGHHECVCGDTRRNQKSRRRQ